jgi:hypothetical protein
MSNWQIYVSNHYFKTKQVFKAFCEFEVADFPEIQSLTKFPTKSFRGTRTFSIKFQNSDFVAK